MLHFVDGVTHGVFVCFKHRFRESWVSVDGFGHKLDRRFQANRGDAGGDHVRDVRADHVDAEELAVLLFADDLHEAIDLADRHRLAEDAEVGFADSNVVALILRFLLGEADAGDLGDRIDAVRDGFVFDLTLVVMNDVVGDDRTLVRCDVGELDAASDVTDGPDVRAMGLERVIDDFDAALVQLDADSLEVHAIGIRFAANAEENDFDFDDFAALEKALPAAGGFLYLLNAGTGLDFNALATKLLAEFDAEILVAEGNQGIHQLDEVNLGAEAIEYISELRADGSAADDKHALGSLAAGYGFVASPNTVLRIALEAGDGKMNDAGAHREDEVLRFDGALRAILVDLDRILVDELGKAFDVLDLVLLEEHADATALSLDDLLAAIGVDLEVESDLARNVNAEVFGVLNMVQSLDAGDHGFAGDASPVETGATEKFLLDTDDLRAELGGTDRGHITAGAGTDYNNICIEILIRHRFLSLPGSGAAK